MRTTLQTLLFSAAGVLFGSLPLAGQTPVEQAPAPSPIQPLLEENLAINDVVVQGVRLEGAQAQGVRGTDQCSYPTFFLKIRGVAGRSRTVILQSNEHCQPVVAAKQEGPARLPLGFGERGRNKYSIDVPPGSVGEVEVRRPTRLLSDPDPKGDTPFSEKAPPPVYGPPAPAETIISQTVWMYGYGGQWDRLTEKNGYLRFAWDTDKAWTKERQGWC